MKNKTLTTTQKQYKDEEFIKMQQQLKTIEKAQNPVMLRFPLGNIYQICVEEASKLTTSNTYLIQAGGHKIINILLEKFNTNEELIAKLLSIIQSALQTLDDDETSFEIASTTIPKSLLQFIDQNKFPKIKSLSYNILNFLSLYPVTHSKLIEQGIFDFFLSTLENFLSKDFSNLPEEILIEIAKIFDMIKFFGKNEKIADQLAQKPIITKMIQVHKKYENMGFLRDLLIKALIPMSRNQMLRNIIKKDKLDFEQFVTETIRDQNLKTIQSVKSLLKNMMEKEDIENALQKAQTSKSEQSIIFLSFLSSHSLHVHLFEKEDLIGLLVEKMKDQNSSEFLKLSVINIIKDIVASNINFFQVFLNKGGIEQILQTLEDPTDDSQFYLVSILEFITLLIEAKPDFVDQLIKKKIHNRFLDYYNKLSKEFQKFLEKALTNTLAQNSIEWEKSGITRALLQSRKKIDQSTLVPMQLALKYLSCENLVNSLLKFFASFQEMDKSKSLYFNEEFFETTNLIIRVFKNSKEVFESISYCFSKSTFDVKQGEIIYRLKIMYQFCEKVWIQHKWRKFFLYSLRYVENIIKDEQVLKIMKQDLDSIRLVASIKNFINEEDYEQFEEEENEEEAIKDILTYAEEREIHKKSSVIIEKLMDSQILQNFQTKIQKTLQFFKPNPQTISILRSEYAVISIANGINSFGCEGLKQDMQNWLLENIQTIEKSSKGQDFKNKEKLLGDCIRALTNYVGITFNQKGKNLYEEKQISAKVFNLFDKYLTESKTPLKSFVMLKVFKEWLVERIEIIENATNQERMQIYDKESFMMVALEQKEEIITKVMDALYGTHGKFETNETIVNLNFEVIILLGYVYPEWKSKVGKNFIPQILDVIQNEKFDKNTKKKALDLLGNLTGCDEKSESVNQQLLNFAEQKEAIEIITNCIANNDNDQDLVDSSKKILDHLGKNEENLEKSYNLIDELIKQIRDYNQSSDKTQPTNIMKVKKAVDQLNALCLVDPLRIYAFGKDHTKVINDLWTFLNDQRNKDISPIVENLMKKLEKGCGIAISQHIKSANNKENQEKLLGKNSSDLNNPNSPILNAIKSLQKNKNDGDIILLNSKIVNFCFPSDYSKNAKEISKNLKFQPELEQILKEFGESQNQDLNREVKELYMNLSENQDDDMMNRMLKKILNQLKQDLNKGQLSACSDGYNSLLPFVNNSVFSDLFNEMDVLDYILKTLKLLHKNTKDKTKKKPAEILDLALSSETTPDLGSEQRKILEEDRNLAKHITQFILKLPEKIREKVRNHEQIVALSDIAGLLNGSPQTFELYDDYLKRPANAKIIEENNGLELGTFLLMKNNQDSFSQEQLGEGVELNISTLNSRSSMQVNDLQASQLSMQQANMNKDDILRENLENFGKVAEKILTQKKFDDIMKKYIKANNNYLPDKSNTMNNLLNISRQVAAILQSQGDRLNLDPYAKDLKQSYAEFLKKVNKEKEPNKKMMKLFENNFNTIGKRLKENDKNFKSPLLWNEMLRRYFVLSPSFLKQNPKTIFENLEIVKPVNVKKLKKVNKFVEKCAEFSLEPENEEEDPLDQENQKNSNQILKNFYQILSETILSENLIISNLEGLTNSPKFSSDFVQKEYFDMFLDKMCDSGFSNDLDLFSNYTETFNNVVNVVQKDPSREDLIPKFQKFCPSKYLEPLLKNFEQKKEGFTAQSIKTLDNVFPLIINKTDLKTKNLPKLLVNLISDNYEENFDTGILLCKAMREPLLQNQFEELNLFSPNLESLQNSLFSQKRIIENPKNFSVFQDKTQLDEDQNKKALELRAFILGDLSNDYNNAKKLKLKPKEDPMFCLNLYDEFEKYGHIPIIATKTIQAVRNAVLEMTNEEMAENEPKVLELIQRIPPQIEKYKQFVKTPQFLKDILERLKLFTSKLEPKSALERLINQLVQNKDELKDRLEDQKDMAEIYRELAEKLQNSTLNNLESKALELLNREVANLLSIPQSDSPINLHNLDINKNLRLIANAPNSTMSQKQEALELLNDFLKNKDVLGEMLKDNFYVQKSQELINDLLKEKQNTRDLKNEEAEVLEQDLKFMRQLTSDPTGVEHVMSGDKNKLIQNCLKVLQGDNPNVELKIEAAKILKNLIKFGKNQELEEKLLSELPNLLKENENPELLAEIVDIALLLCDKNPENKEKLSQQEILEPIKKGLQLHRGNDKLNLEVSKLLFKLAEENPSTHQRIFDSQILPFLTEPFKNKNSSKQVHENLAKLLMQLGFGNPEKKKELVNQGWIKGLVPLLIHYSSEENYDPEMITIVLKCMANFSLIPEGVDHLLFDGVIPAFKNFFDKYKETLPEQNELLLQSLANLSYDNQEKFVTKMIGDKAIELILEAMDFYNKKQSEKNTEVAIDALTLITHSPMALEYLEKNKNNAIDILVDILRQQTNSPLVYKSLRCLTNFANSKILEEQILKKEAHRAAADLFQDFKSDFKNIFQALKFLNLLVKNNPDKIDEFFFAGIPEKIIHNIDLDWPVDIIKEILTLFSKMAGNEEVKNVIGEQFVSSLIPLIEKHFSNKNIVKQGIHLLAICSDNITSAEQICHNQGNQLADQILQKYLSSEEIIYDNLIMMENTIRMTEESKPEFLKMKSDDLVEKIVDTTNPDSQKDLHQQAVIVLELLRDKNIENVLESHINEQKKEEPSQRQQEENIQERKVSDLEQVEDEDNLDKVIPPNVQKFLKQGRILRVYGDDGVCRSMHFYLSQDMTDLKCKHPKENFVKQKWIMPIHLVKDVMLGYNKDSPIAKSGSFFKKAPKQEQCFVVFGPTLFDGPQNFHMKCNDRFDAEKWVEYLDLVLDEYKKKKAKNLKRDKNIS